MAENTSQPTEAGLFAALAGSVLRSGLLAAAAWLTAHGWLDPASHDAFLQIGLGIAMGLVGLGWSLAQKWLAHARLVKAFWAEPPK